LYSDDAACTHPKVCLAFAAHCSVVTVVLACLLNSLVRVSRRVGWAGAALLLWMAGHMGSTPKQQGCPSEKPGHVAGNRRGTQVAHLALPSQSLPCWQFHALLTLFSKFFSVFPHGTCLLSVSCRYLALDGVYHPLWTAIPNSPTLSLVRMLCQLPKRGCHPPWPLIPQQLRQPARHAHPGSKLQLGARLAQITSLGSSLFTRSYWGNPC
jgi:hypothetical protein